MNNVLAYERKNKVINLLQQHKKKFFYIGAAIVERVVLKKTTIFEAIVSMISQSVPKHIL